MNLAEQRRVNLKKRYSMRHLYASYGWALGTKPYENIDFNALNLKSVTLVKLQSKVIHRSKFLQKKDKVQKLLETFRTLGERGITKRYPGSRVSFENHKKNFLSLGLLGLIERARPPFRNSKLGFAEEGRIILSKIQNSEKKEKDYLKILTYKKINIGATCLINIFKRWKVGQFQSRFIGDLTRLLEPEREENAYATKEILDKVKPMRLDKAFICLIQKLEKQSIPLANPGIFLFLPYLNQLKIFEKASGLMELDQERGYSWFSLLLVNLGRIFGGISSISKACRISEPSLPLLAGLVSMPCNDSVLNGLALIDEDRLLALRQYLTKVAKEIQLIKGKKIAFDFKMRDFTGDDTVLKNIGKGPSPKRKICFPGFRPHIAWDMETGTPITIEFRNGKVRATKTIKRFIKDLLDEPLGSQNIEHVYLDSEYTAVHVWKYVVDPNKGLGADLTMCVKRNRKVKKYIDKFLATAPTWIYFDDEHTCTEETFDIPIDQTDKILHCVLKRNEKNGNLRCFGTTLDKNDSKGILMEYKTRWIIECGIKDLVQNYFFDHEPGINPHRINVHYFVVTLARILYEMFSRDYNQITNADNTQKMLGTLRSEFITGANAVISRSGDTLVLKWMDLYPEKRQRALKSLFDKLNKDRQTGLPFLGGLKLHFEIQPPRSETMQNRCQRDYVEF